MTSSNGNIFRVTGHLCGEFIIFTRGQFWPSGIVVACVCVCVCVCVCLSVCLCVNHEFVRAITHHLFKLGSPNLDQRCKRPWLRSLLFLGVIDLDLQGQIWLQSRILPHFEFVRAIIIKRLKLESPCLGQKCIFIWFRSLLILGLINLELQFHFNRKTYFFCQIQLLNTLIHY